MSRYSATPAIAAQDSARVAHQLYHQLAQFLAPLLRTLDQQLDRRLVSTFLATLIAIIQSRNRAHGLVLSELGAYLLRPEQAPAGTKRLSKVLRSSRWKAKLLADWLWQQADARVVALRTSGEEPLLIWDGSVLLARDDQERRAVCGALQQGAPYGTHPPGLLQPTRRPPNLCPGPALAGPAGARARHCAYRCGDAVVDQAW